MSEDKKYWYAIRSKPKKEDFLFRQLLSREIETFYPRIRTKPVNPRARKWAPYFPGYMFVHVNLDQTGVRPLNRIPGSVGLVMFDQHVPIVPEAVLTVIKHQVEATTDDEGRLLTTIPPGSQIRVVKGSFKGYEAIFDMHLRGHDRVRVLLKMLSDRLVSVELESDAVEVLKDDQKDK